MGKTGLSNYFGKHPILFWIANTILIYTYNCLKKPIVYATTVSSLAKKRFNSFNTNLKPSDNLNVGLGSKKMNLFQKNTSQR